MESTSSSKKYLLIIPGIIFAFLLLVAAELFLNWYLNYTGYFTAMTPRITEIYETNEFKNRAIISNQGMRNRLTTEQKPDNIYRILVLGDSFTFGWGVEENQAWPQLLEKSVKIPGKKVEVINAGAPGMELGSATTTCNAYANRFQVDAVIVGFYSTDDFNQLVTINNQEENQTIWTRLFPTLTRIKNPSIIPTWHNAKEGSTVKTTVYWKNQAQAFALSNQQIVNRLQPELKDAFLQGKLNPYLLYYATIDPQFLIHILDKNYFSKALNITEEKLEAFKKCSKNHPVSIVFLPSYELINKDFFQYKKALGYEVNEKLLSIDIDTPMKKIVEKNGFKYISLLKEFRQTKCEDCYYKWDMHFTPNGHKKVAEYITTLFQ